MGFSLMLTMAASVSRSKPVQWSPFVFATAEECQQFGQWFYRNSETIEDWSVNDVPESPQYTFANGKLKPIKK